MPAYRESNSQTPGIMTSRGYRRTNGSNDGGTAVVPRGRHLRAELGVPLQLHAVAEMVEGACGSHGVCRLLSM